ncbi:unnamed protein product, partial [Scytosiphon promiscuus]
ETCECAAGGGHLELLQWAKAQRCALGTACLPAIRHGHLDTLKWLVANGCFRTNIAAATAAVAGHIHILEWMHASPYSWDYQCVWDAAVAGGHEGVLQRARYHGFH